MNNESLKLSLHDVYCDFLGAIKVSIEPIADTQTQSEACLHKTISVMFLVVPEITDALRSFFSVVSQRLSVDIELIETTTSLCLSYGFFDNHVTKKLILFDFGWESVRLSVVEHANEFRIVQETAFPELSGFSIATSLAKSIQNRYVSERHAVDL